MSEGVRVIGPDRTQLRWDMVDLDSQLPDDHRARLVWAFVEGLDLSEFYDRIRRVTRLPAGRQPIRGWCWRFGSMRRWKGSAPHPPPTPRATTTRALPGCAAGGG